MKISSKYILVKLDRIDKNIIRALQNNGRMQNNDLAREIGLSPSSCLRRVKLLEEAGVIQNYTAVVDPQKIGFQLLLFSRIWLVGQDAETIDSFIEAMKELPAALMLRPFNYETLATLVYQYVKAEQLAEGAFPALLIVAVGLLPLLFMNHYLGERKS